MSWVTIVWSMAASACLTLAVIQFLIWCTKRTAWDNLLFSLTAVATAAVASCEFWMLRAQTPDEFSTALRWLHVPVWVMILSLVGLMRIHLRAGRPWLAWTVCGLRTISLLLNFLTGQNLNFRETNLRHIQFLGESVSVAEGVRNPWMVVGQLSLFLLVVFVADTVITVWRRGDRRTSLVTSGSILFFVLAGTVQSLLVAWDMIHWPVIISFFFLAVIAAVAYEMGIETLRAAQLSEDLLESEERLSLAAEAGGVGVWMWNIARNKVWASEKWHRMFGFASDADIRYEDILQRIHPDDRERVDCSVRRAIEDGVDYVWEYRMMAPDGTLRWLTARGRLHSDKHGKSARLLGASMDISELQRAKNQLEERLAFERLLANISARFIAISGDRLDSEIELAQRLVCEFLNIDISTLWQLPADHPGSLLLTHYHAPPDFPPVPKLMDANESFPWCLEKLQNGESVILSRLTDVPAAAARDLELWRYYGIKSVLTFPLSAGGGTVFGALGFNVIREEREWPTELINRLQLIAGVFANALARKATENALHESEARLSLAADSASAGLWSWDYTSGQIWATEKAHMLYGIPLDEKVTFNRFMGTIHPDDHDRVDDAARLAFKEGTDFHSEYRIMLPNQGIRWISARARVYLKHSGELDRMMGVSLDITDRKHDEKNLLDSRQALRMFTSRLLTIQEEERRRLARELHDDFTQRLAVLAMDLSKLGILAKATNTPLESKLHHTRDQVIKLSTDILDISRQLHPSIIDDLGLERAIQSECTNFTRRTGIVIHYTPIRVPAMIPRDISVGLFRITQEALRNIHKHAQVKEAEVCLVGEEDRLTLTIDDSGVGFDPACARQSHGVGLFSMEERAQLVQGIFSIVSAPGHGTQIEVVAPVKEIESGQG